MLGTRLTTHASPGHPTSIGGRPKAMAGWSNTPGAISRCVLVSQTDSAEWRPGALAALTWAVYRPRPHDVTLDLDSGCWNPSVTVAGDLWWSNVSPPDGWCSDTMSGTLHVDGDDAVFTGADGIELWFHRRHEDDTYEIACNERPVPPPRPEG